MSSFLSNSTIGMGGSDFRGSIQQPLMDWKVIFISGLSSEDTHRGASDSESSSSDRLKVSCRTGGGTSGLHGRVWPSTASPAKELILVTVISPLLLLGDQGEVMGTLGHLPACDVGITLGRHSPHLPLLAMSR